MRVACLLGLGLDAAGAGWFQSRAGGLVFGASSLPFNGGQCAGGDPVAQPAAAPEEVEAYALQS